ncbi:hypothetical protein PIB30_028897 [Stylosanthes scabra]|uniref:Dof zinc finger protein n=1 Tax=Stylosanthes scabra TaxID=79078 RepID=A0ABU6YBM7_9FABA|nr:hypothetical protein [Stylosanthes scabra]
MQKEGEGEASKEQVGRGRGPGLPRPREEPPQHKCPRCDSENTKFCYYNNYSLSQPRYLCKACKRYWTQGGTLRNIPLGSSKNKNKHNKRPFNTTSSSSSSSNNNQKPPQPYCHHAAAAATSVGGSTTTITCSFLGEALPSSAVVQQHGFMIPLSSSAASGSSMGEFTTAAASHQLQHQWTSHANYSFWSTTVSTTSSSSIGANNIMPRVDDAPSSPSSSSFITPNQWLHLKGNHPMPPP